MARIDSYTTVTPTLDDYLLGTDDPGGAAPTRNFTVQSIVDLVDDEAAGNTNDYLDGITVESGYSADASDTATITFSVGSQTDITLDLGGAAFKAQNYYAKASAFENHIDDTSQPHSLDSIVGNQSLSPTKLKGITGNGQSGQTLTSDGAGNFAWATDSDANDNYYLSSVTRPDAGSNDILFTMTGGGSNVTASIFGEGAFMSKADIRADVESNQNFTAEDFTFLGDLATKTTISSGDIAENAVTTNSIAVNAITEEKLNITNDPTDGYVLTADGTDGEMQWVANSASNYYLDDITKSNNELTFSINGGTDVTYTFGAGAFANLGTGTNDIARGDHSHNIGDLTNAGALASKSAVGTAEINNKAVTAGKLSPATAGTDGQVLSINSSSELVWVNSSGTSIADVRLLPSTIGATNSGTAGTGPQVLRVNSAGTLVEYADLSVEKNEFNTGNSPSAGKVLGLDTNNDLQWIDAPTAGINDDAITPSKIDFIDDSLSASTAGHMLISDGTDFSNVAISGDATITSAGVLSIADTISKSNTFKIVGTRTGTAISPALALDFRTMVDHSDIQILANGTGSDIRVQASENLNLTGKQINLTSSNNIATDGTDASPKFLAVTDSAGKVKTKEINIAYSNLSDEFTARASNVTLSSSTTAVDLDFTSDGVFEVTTPTDSTNITIDFDNADIGMTKMLLLKNQSTAGTGTVTFSQSTGTGTFVRLSSDDIVRTASTTNYIQITCIDKSSDDCTYVYTVGTAQ